MVLLQGFWYSTDNDKVDLQQVLMLNKGSGHTCPWFVL
jgi:hypothetical protein